MKLVLLGDSIRMGYQDAVKTKCPEAEVWGPEFNGCHSQYELDRFQEWVVEREPDVLHINFGIHDSMQFADGRPQILPDQYRINLTRYVARIKELKTIRMIWATTTPVFMPTADVPMSDWPPNPTHPIDEYNEAALTIVNEEGLQVNDLHAVIMANDYARCLCEDGCHMTDFGNEVLSDAVVEAVRQT